jgi:hypothetical protein
MDAATIYMSTSHKADGRRRGQGVRVFSGSGAKYDGAWDNDLMHGYGVFVKATGAVADRGIYTGTTPRRRASFFNPFISTF